MVLVLGLVLVSVFVVMGWVWCSVGVGVGIAECVVGGQHRRAARLAEGGAQVFQRGLVFWWGGVGEGGEGVYVAGGWSGVENGVVWWRGTLPFFSVLFFLLLLLLLFLFLRVLLLSFFAAFLVLLIYAPSFCHSPPTQIKAGVPGGESEMGGDGGQAGRADGPHAGAYPN